MSSETQYLRDYHPTKVVQLASVAAFGQLLRGGKYTQDFDYKRVYQLAQLSLGRDTQGWTLPARKPTVLDAVDPPVHGERLAALPCIPHDRRFADVTHLLGDVAGKGVAASLVQSQSIPKLF